MCVCLFLYFLSQAAVFSISSKRTVLPGRNDADMGPANSLHASTYYSESNEKFDLIFASKKRYRVCGNAIMTCAFLYSFERWKFQLIYSRCLALNK